jgi:hypothetical protein
MEDALKGSPGWRGRAAHYLALEHNVTIASAAVFLILNYLVRLHPSSVSLARPKTFSMPAINIPAALSPIVSDDAELS